MAKKTAFKNTEYHCRECAHSHSPHEKGWNGEPFLCKCDFQSRSMFLDRDYCHNFKLKLA